MKLAGRMLAAACALAILSPVGAAAHCSAKDVLDRLNASPRASVRADAPATIRSAADVLVWKTIVVGTFSSSFTLRNTLDALHCGVGDGAEQILARPSFALSRDRAQLDLVAVTPGQLGFGQERVPLPEIYARAEQLGLELAPAEVGPQLRLQYADQPIGEFLTVGMKPLHTWSGESLVFVVANGGAGLHLLSHDADASIHAKSRVVFMRRRLDADVAFGQ